MAPKGNQFWKLRSKHGRDKLFASPELLWEAATEYFQWCDNNPWQRKEQAKGTIKPVYDETKKKYIVPDNIVSLPTQRPYTLSGFCVYTGASESYWRELRKNKNLTQDFLSVIHTIEEIITTQQFEGAAVGAFNGNIIARKLGLRDGQEITGKDGKPLKIESKSNVDYSKLPPEVLEAIMNARIEVND